MTIEYTADQLVAAIGNALEERVLDAVPGLIMMLAVVDPYRAQDVLDVIELGLALAQRGDR